MRQAGRYLPEYHATRARAGSFLNLCYNSASAAEVTLQPIRRYALDAAILFSDILVVPHALGQALDYVEGEGRKLDPVTDAVGIDRLSAGRLHEVLGPVYETVGRVAAALPPEAALIGFAGAPWTVATYKGGGSKKYAAVKRLAPGRPGAGAGSLGTACEIRGVCEAGDGGRICPAVFSGASARDYAMTTGADPITGTGAGALGHVPFLTVVSN